MRESGFGVEFHGHDPRLQMERLQPRLQRRQHAFHRCLRIGQADTARDLRARFQYEPQIQQPGGKRPTRQPPGQGVQEPLE